MPLPAAKRSPSSQRAAASSGRWFRPQTLLDKTFEIGILLKGLDGIVEIAGAVLVFFVKPQTINHIADMLVQRIDRWSQNPDNFLAAHILSYARELAGGDKFFVMFFLLSHGLIKIVLVVGLLRNVRWAYPFAFVTLGAFIAYQLYLILMRPSFGMVFLTIFDAFIIWLTWREYQKYQTEHQPKPE